MGFYSNVVLPRIYDFAMDRPVLAKHRAEQLAGASGKVLEVGAGTGLNLPHYPAEVRLTTIDPNPGMNRKLALRAAATNVAIERTVGSGESLPFDDNTFDAVVTTLVLCSLPDVNRSIGEILRVLKPGGRYLFLEHGLSPDPRVSKWQRRLNPLQRLLADGCRLDLDVRGVLAQQSFQTVEMHTFSLENVPRTHGFLYRGTATR